MADNDDLQLPLEIPWRLASTTLPFNTGEPDQTSLSLFFFEPDDAALTSKFPDEKLVFLKFAVSISPASFPLGSPPFGGSFLGEGVPCYHMLLDAKVRLKSGETGTIRPYFHAAAPLNRRMLQTGIVGHEIAEGEAASQFMGKSGSQLHESLNSESRTNSASASAGFSVGGFGASGSVRTTSTDISSNRAVAQTVDTTTRQASEERRELVSHSTKVENLLTLLNAKYIGTPFLSFSLNPRPLELLSLDPSDPNLWFSQLLARRSSGIEGLQEFTAVVVVPRDQDFCVSARLRRVCLLDVPPGPLTFDERYNNTFEQLFRMLDYVERTFPSGTPIEELDVEVVPALAPPEKFPRPVVNVWEIASIGGFLCPIIFVVSPNPVQVVTSVSTADVVYKHPLELWLDTMRDEYEQDVARSPLERGVLLGENLTLDTCFTFSQAALAPTNSSSSISALLPLDIDPGEIDIGGVRNGALDQTRDVRARAIETITRWNALERQLATILNNRRVFPKTKPPKLNDPRVVGVLVERWAKLEPQDTRNLDFNAAVAALGLSAEHRRLLKSAGATDLRSIARALNSAPKVERYNADFERRQKLDRKRKSSGKPISFAISSAKSEEMRRAIGDAMAKSLAPAIKG
jgi:hypothetical protein